MKINFLWKAKEKRQGYSWKFYLFEYQSNYKHVDNINEFPIKMERDKTLV